MIRKYTLAVRDEQLIDLPSGAKILRVGIQDEEIRLWALGDMSKGTVSRWFYLYGTGMTPESDQEYIGTVQLDRFVWHIFVREGEVEYD